MTCKTPVAILQELMVQRKETPNYNLIVNQVGTHEPLFKYSLSGLGLRAIGSGKSKKEAKHEAARLLLHMLKDKMDIPELNNVAPILQEVEVCYSPYDNTIKDNAVGDLQTFCCGLQLPCPKYELILDIGPPHFKLFAIRCTVSSLSQKASARTKKQAKHRSSVGMLQKLKLCLSDYIDFDESCDNKKLCKLGQMSVSLFYPFSVLHDVYFKSEGYIPSNELEEIRKNIKEVNDIEEPLEKLKLICEELNFELDVLELPSVQKDKHVVNIFLISRPGWSFINYGETYDIACNNAAVEALQFLIDMTPSDTKVQ